MTQQSTLILTCRFQPATLFYWEIIENVDNTSRIVTEGKKTSWICPAVQIHNKSGSFKYLSFVEIHNINNDIIKSDYLNHWNKQGNNLSLHKKTVFTAGALL